MKKKELKGIKCECGYFNKQENIDIWGSCKLCGKTLDKKKKYEYEMFQRLHLWTKKGHGGYGRLGLY